MSFLTSSIASKMVASVSALFASYLLVSAAIGPVLVA
jgi:hypothetical protein